MSIVFTEDGVCYNISSIHYQIDANNVPYDIIIASDSENILMEISNYSLIGFDKHFNGMTWRHEALYGRLKPFTIIGMKSVHYGSKS